MLASRCFAIDLVEPREVQRFAPEQLHRRHPGDVLLQKRVDARDPAAHDAVRLADVAPEPLRDEDDERQHGEGDQRQPPVHPQHHAHDADEREHVAEDRDDAGREQIVQHVHVGGDARHQPADRIAIVVLQVEPLQVAVDRHAQVEHDALAGQLHRPGLHVFGRERQRPGRTTIDAASRSEPVELTGRDVPVDGDLDQIRLRERRRRRQAMIATNATATWRQYGRRYASSRRISRASYALPRIFVVVHGPSLSAQLRPPAPLRAAASGAAPA